MRRARIRIEFRRAMVDRKDFVAVLEQARGNEQLEAEASVRAGQGHRDRRQSWLSRRPCRRSDGGQPEQRARRPRGSSRSIATTWSIRKIIEAQMESGAIYGLTAALYGEITVKDGQVQELNFDTYRMLSMAEAPTDRGLSHAHRRHDAGRRPSGAASANAAPRPSRPRSPMRSSRPPAKRVRELPLKNVKLAEIASL